MLAKVVPVLLIVIDAVKFTESNDNSKPVGAVAITLSTKRVPLTTTEEATDGLPKVVYKVGSTVELTVIAGDELPFTNITTFVALEVVEGFADETWTYNCWFNADWTIGL